MQRIDIWRFATLFLTGLVLGMSCLMIWQNWAPDSKVNSGKNVGEVAENQFNVLPSIPTPNAKTEEAVTNVELIAQGDNYFMGGNCSLALKKYRSIKGKAGENTSLTLRKAACFEQLSELDSAEVAYRNTLTNAPNLKHRLLAMAGFGRVLVKQRRVEEAIAILAEQLLRIDQDRSIPSRTRSQLYFEYSKALEARITETAFSGDDAKKNNSLDYDDLPDLLGPLSLATVNSLNNPEEYLQMIDQPTEPVEVEQQEHYFKILQRPSDAASTITAEISVGLQPVPLLLDQITQIAGLELQISEKARDTIAGRSRVVHVDSTTLSSYYDQLLISFGLVWQQADQTIYVVHAGELNEPNMWMDFQFQSAARSFRRFEIDFPSDPFRKAATLSRARIAMLAHDYNRAANLFRELEQSQPIGEVKAKSYFNQAKLSQLLNRPEEAIQLYYRAIDQTMEANVEASGYCMLSQLHITTGEIKEAIRAGRRGLATAVTLDQRQEAAVNLAKAYLLDNDPFSANMTLFRNRSMIKEKNHRMIAAFLGAYARSIGVTEIERVMIAKNRLLTSLSTLETEQYATFADCYLASMAYESLGFRDRSIAMLTLALSKPDVGSWQRKVFFELGMLQRKMDMNVEAIASFNLLVSQDDEWRTRALLQLARLYSQTKQWDQCIVVCKALWNSELDEAEKRMTLQILGSAFQAKGQHYSAALCFAGMLPGEI